MPREAPRTQSPPLVSPAGLGNSYKGPNITGFYPATGHVDPPFNPRAQAWADHFELRGALIVGLSPVVRTTVELLSMNEGRRVQLRADLNARGESGRGPVFEVVQQPAARLRARA